MSALALQKDLIATLKRETFHNVTILRQKHTLSSELSQLFKEEACEKPTQNFFNHLTHYLICIIDPAKGASMSWPLYDTKTERAYRNELFVFISEYSKKRLLSPVLSSYLVNPGCPKIITLIYQMSQLALKRVLESVLKETKKEIYHDVTKKYKNLNKQEFKTAVAEETKKVSNKFSTALKKKRVLIVIAKVLCKRITVMESKIASLNCNGYLENLTDKFLEQNSVSEDTKTEILNIKNINQPLPKLPKFLEQNSASEDTKTEILKIKNVNQPLPIFDSWLEYFEENINEMDKKFCDRFSPVVELASNTVEQSKRILSIHTGEAEKTSYMVEFDPKTDYICTKNLESQVNCEQKHILKNIVHRGILSFPNLVRGFVVATSFALKNVQIGGEVYKFCDYLTEGNVVLNDHCVTMRSLIENIIAFDNKLQVSPNAVLGVSRQDVTELPPLPDLSNLIMKKDVRAQILFDNFTPFHARHEFNLYKKSNIIFMKPKLKSCFQVPKEDLLKNLKMNATSYTHNSTQNLLNISAIPKVNRNETIAECSAGFTKAQIQRLFSTKKSTSKKIKHEFQRPSTIKKRNKLFNESFVLNDSTGLIRSNSSPELFEGKSSFRGRVRSILHEDPMLEVSGISILGIDSGDSTPRRVRSSENFKTDSDGIPRIVITQVEDKLNNILKETDIEKHKDDNTTSRISAENLPHVIESNEEIVESLPERVFKERMSNDNEIKVNNLTPVNMAPPKKISSIERIINRFKKVRASVICPEGSPEQSKEFQAIIEERENINIEIPNSIPSKILLPDLLSPSCSMVSFKTDIPANVEENKDFVDFKDFTYKSRKPRESLGSMLGVDQTFLDQFDLID